MPFHRPRPLAVLPLLSFFIVGFAAAAAGVVAYGGAQRQMADRAAEEARAVAALAVATLAELRELPDRVEEMLAGQLAGQATLADLLVLAAESGKGEAAANARLAAAAAIGGTLETILVTDRAGRVLFQSRAAPDVVFAEDGTPPAHARALAALIAGAPPPAAPPAAALEPGGPLVKTVAIRGSRERLIQVTAGAGALELVRRRTDIDSIAERLTGAGLAEAVWLIGPDGYVLSGAAPDDEAVEQARRAVTGRTSSARSTGGAVVAAAPLLSGDRVVGALTLRRSLPAFRADGWIVAAAVAAAALVAGLVAAIAALWAKRRADESLRALRDAAQALDNGRFNPFALDGLRAMPNVEGEAAKAFLDMARSIASREDTLEVKLLLADTNHTS